MGYYASGSAVFTLPENACVLMELNIEELETIVGSPLSSDNIADKILEACSFENYDTEEDRKLLKDDQGNLVVEGYSGDKWYSSTDDVIEWVGRHGAGVSGSFTGEDYQSWGYATKVGTNTPVEYAIAHTPTVALEQTEKLLAYCRKNNLNDLPSELKEILNEMVEIDTLLTLKP